MSDKVNMAITVPAATEVADTATRKVYGPEAQYQSDIARIDVVTNGPRIRELQSQLAAAQAELRETREQREQAIKERDEAQKRLAERCTTIMPTPPSSEHATTAMGLLCHKTGNKMLCDREPVPNPRTTGGRMWDCANCEGSRGATMALLPFTAYSASDAAKRMESIIVERDEAIRERALLSKACDDITAMLNEANVPSAGLGIDERIALMLDDNTALASQNAVMREALEHFLDCLDAANAEGFAKIRLDARYSDYPARALVDLVERHLLFDTVYKANAALSATPTHAEQTWQVMRDVCEAAKAYSDNCHPIDCWSNAECPEPCRSRQLCDALARLDALKVGEKQ